MKDRTPDRRAEEAPSASKRAEGIKQAGGAMGFMFRVRLSSFLAGAATSSVLGFYLLYKDYMFAREAISQKVRGICETLDERYEALNGRITALESLKEVETAKTVEGSE